MRAPGRKSDRAPAPAQRPPGPAPRPPRPAASSAVRRDGGFSAAELMIALVVLSVVLVVGYRGYLRFSRSATVDRAAKAVAADVSLARSYALQRRSTVSLVADEAARSYAIRDDGKSPADTLVTARFDRQSDVPLTSFDVAGGSSLTFNSRGLLTGGTTSIDLEYLGRQKRVRVNSLGRTKIEKP